MLATVCRSWLLQIMRKNNKPLLPGNPNTSKSTVSFGAKAQKLMPGS